MFQYAMYRFLVQRFGRSRVKCDITWFSWNNAHQGFELTKLFQRKDNPDFFLDRASLGQIFNCSGKVPQKGLISRIINRTVRAVFQNYFEKRLISETGRESSGRVPHALKEIQKLKGNEDIYITGYFLDESYYKDNLPLLRKALSFDIRSLNNKSRSLLKSLLSEDSVAIHVRRGDYLQPGYTENFINLGMDYYKKAVEAVGQHIKDPKYYLFSDDPDFLNEAFDWLPNKIIVDWNKGAESWMDLYLMSKCRGCITANSTFSEWAGLLNERKESIIIYPREYMKDKESDIKTIPGWIRI